MSTEVVTHKDVLFLGQKIKIDHLHPFPYKTAVLGPNFDVTY